MNNLYLHQFHYFPNWSLYKIDGGRGGIALWAEARLLVSQREKETPVASLCHLDFVLDLVGWSRWLGRNQRVTLKVEDSQVEKLVQRLRREFGLRPCLHSGALVGLGLTLGLGLGFGWRWFIIWALVCDQFLIPLASTHIRGIADWGYVNHHFNECFKSPINGPDFDRLWHWLKRSKQVDQKWQGPKM